MLPRIISAIGATLSSDEIDAVARVVPPRKGQSRGVYHVVDELTGVLVEYHAYKYTAYTTPGNIIGGYADNGTSGSTSAFKFAGAKLFDFGFMGTGNVAAIFGLSNKGKTAVGAATPSSGAQSVAVVWTKAEGFIDLGADPGFSGAAAVSNDGLVLVGWQPANGSFRCVRTGSALPLTNTLTYLPFLPNSTYSMGLAVSSDGSIVAGCAYMTSPAPRSVSNPTYHGYRWSAIDGVEDIGLPAGATYAVATGVSDDGNTIGGYWGSDPTTAMPTNPSLVALTNLSYGVEGGFRGFVWKRVAGSPDTITDIGFLPSGTFAYVTGVSGDGLTLVGYADTPSGMRAFRRTDAEGMVDLGLPAGATAAVATAVTTDGKSITGFVVTSTGRRSFIWRKQGGYVWPKIGATPDRDILPAGTYSLATCIAN